MANLFESVIIEKQTACGPIADSNLHLTDHMPVPPSASSEPKVTDNMPVFKPAEQSVRLLPEMPVLTIAPDGSIDCHKR